ncbi:CBS domain-containing protein [Rhizobium sp. BK251]|uniref:CBS domain-containing protein n=1 Tax=Rhizobium sp. BK251 TaxID=2512125 RepID=UPI001044C719|nr:CBS domain-containing protein [Rhizobium sp. BK251]TCL65241.1 BON domain-containing protein [Rhizobium sp. BK251]
MRVKDVMTAKVVTVSSDSSVRQAAEIMLAYHISGVPVIDGDGRLVGMISEGDLIRRTELGAVVPSGSDEQPLSAAERANAYIKRTSWRVGDAMTADLVAAEEDTPLTQVASLMEKRRVKRIPVLRDGQLVGIVSRADLLQAIITARKDETAAGDDAIQRSIAIRLRENTGLEGQDVTVTVSDGIVHLWGKIETEECRRAARVVAEGVRGVRGVVEHLS